MKSAWAVILGVILLAPPGLARAEDAGPPRSATAAAAAPAPPRLKLGPYRSVHADDPLEIVTTPRFEEHVEVHGKAMDARSLTLKLEWWLKDFDYNRGATAASMSAPSIAEMHDYRPHPPDSLNFVPVMEWLTDKLSGKKK